LGMRKKKLLSVLAVFVAIIIIFNVILDVLYINVLELRRYEPEIHPDGYVWFDNLYINEKKYSLNKLLNIDSAKILQVYCVKNNEVYLFYQCRDGEDLRYRLVTINLNNQKVTKIFDETFNFTKQNKYDANFREHYYNRTGYYLEDRIVVTDFEKLVEYDIKNAVTNVFEYADYPKHEVSGIWEIINDENLDKRYIKNAKNDTFIFVDDVRISSAVAESVLSKDYKIMLSETSVFSRFFKDVQIVNNQEYLVTRVLDAWGNTYLLLFKCDFEEKEFFYFGSQRTGDVAWKDEFYVVPVDT